MAPWPPLPAPETRARYSHQKGSTVLPFNSTLSYHARSRLSDKLPPQQGEPLRDASACLWVEIAGSMAARHPVWGTAGSRST
jgi:hypothetical protein